MKTHHNTSKITGCAINKSQLMKRAWNIFRGNNPYSYSFSASLRRAWLVEKSTIEYNQRKANETIEKAKQLTTLKSKCSVDLLSAGCTAYYKNARPGQYFGD